MDLQPDLLFHNRYRLIKETGRGSSGEVWLACDELLNKNIAVKVYVALDDRGVKEFSEEFKTTFNLNHPNLLHAYHFDIDEQRPFLVMPYCPSSAVQLIGNCSTDTMWQFIKDVASGLSYLHSRNVVHHDIKPDNILQNEEGVFVIADFGISIKMRSTLRRNSTRAMDNNSSGGSLPYMGPEMFTSRAESVKATDIWALGVTLYEILTGSLPFFGQGGVMMLRGAEMPEFDCPDPNLEALIKACLSKETWDRPKAEDLVKIAETHTFNFNNLESDDKPSRNPSETVPSDSSRTVPISDGIELTVNGKTHVSSSYMNHVGVENYTVQTNAAGFEVRNLPQWCRLVAKESDSFTIEYQTNTSPKERTGQFEVCANCSGKYVIVKIKQKQRTQESANENNQTNIGNKSEDKKKNEEKKPAEEAAKKRRRGKVWIYIFISLFILLFGLLILYVSNGSVYVSSGERVVSSEGDTVFYAVSATPKFFWVAEAPYWAEIVEKLSNGFTVRYAKDTSDSKQRRGDIVLKTIGHDFRFTITQRKFATYLNIKKNSTPVASAGGARTYTVNTDGLSFNISELPSWCEVISHDSKSFKISIDANTSKDERTAYLLVTADDQEVKVKVTQSGKVATYLTVNGKATLSNVVGVKEGYISYTVDTDGSSYEVVSMPSWCTLKDKSASSFSVAYEENTEAIRSDWFEVVSDSKRVRIYITQSAPGPSARINDVTVEHNVTQSGQKGMSIKVNFDVERMKGKEGKVLAYFYRDNGTPLKDYNKSYYTTSGDVCCSKSFTPRYDSSNYSSLSLFIPNSELHITDSGRTDCYFIVEVHDDNRKWMCSSEKYSFYIDK